MVSKDSEASKTALRLAVQNLIDVSNDTEMNTKIKAK